MTATSSEFGILKWSWDLKYGTIWELKVQALWHWSSVVMVLDLLVALLCIVCQHRRNTYDYNSTMSPKVELTVFNSIPWTMVMVLLFWPLIEIESKRNSTSSLLLDRHTKLRIFDVRTISSPEIMYDVW